MKPSNSAARARGLVNAMLRRALREKDGARSGARRGAARRSALRIPNFSLERWERAFGAEATRRLCAWNNEPAEVHVRANGLKVTVGELLRGTPDAEPSPAHPLMLKVRTLPFSWIAHGLCYVQDPSTLLACELLAPQPGERVLDACAAPGGKTSYLAQLMRNEGRIVACDLYESRVARLRENLARLGVRNTPDRSSTIACRPARRSSPRASTASSSMRRAATPASSAAASMSAGGSPRRISSACPRSSSPSSAARAHAAQARRHARLQHLQPGAGGKRQARRAGARGESPGCASSRAAARCRSWTAWTARSPRSSCAANLPGPARPSFIRQKPPSPALLLRHPPRLSMTFASPDEPWRACYRDLAPKLVLFARQWVSSRRRRRGCGADRVREVAGGTVPTRSRSTIRCSTRLSGRLRSTCCGARAAPHPPRSRPRGGTSSGKTSPFSTAGSSSGRPPNS